MLVVQGLYTEYPNERGEVVKAAQDVSFTVAEGQLFTLLGPSSVNKCPSATVKLTSCAALTTSPASFGYSVNSPWMFSIRDW